MYTLLISLVFGLSTPAELTRDGKYEESEKILSKIKTQDNAEYHYYRMINLHFLNNPECKKHAEEVLDLALWKKVPKRYITLAYIIKFDVKNWKKNDLGDVARDMKHVSVRLKNVKGGPKTQKIQKQIVKKLDKMIKNIEDKNKAAQQAAQAAKAAEMKKWQQRNGGRPLEDSRITGSPQANGRVSAKRIKELVESWGSLPPKERARAMVALTKEYPPKYREIIREYFRRVSIER